MTRRNLITGLAGSIAATPLARAEENPCGIHQEVDLPASPARVYKALTDEKQFAAFSGMAAKFANRAGGEFSIFEGHIVGRNIELVPDKRIVQAWRVVDWTAGLYSIAKFELEPHDSGTHVVFDHTAYPSEQRDHLASGWTEHYWDRLKKYFAQ
jgi:activator of HSP90 ATPase